MLVDDSPAFCQQVRETLSPYGHTVVIAHTVSDAIEEARLCEPDLVFLDIEMPGNDGTETARRIRSLRDASVASTPVIVLTSLSLPGDREHCLAAGATDYWVKPLTAQNVVAAVETHLGRHSIG
jgi:CheY-like chemotaxis protein